MPKSTKLTAAKARRISEQHIVDALLRENVGPDTAKLYRAVVHRLYKDLKPLSPLAQLDLVTSVCTLLFNVAGSSTAYVDQYKGKIDATTDIEALPAPKKTLTEIMAKRINSKSR